MELFKKQNLPFVIGGVIITLVGIGAIIYFFFPKVLPETIRPNPGPESNQPAEIIIQRGGPYEELAKTHFAGEEFLGYINAAYDSLEDDDLMNDMLAYLDLGFYKAELGDIDGAIEAYIVGIAKYPKSEVMIGNLAHIYENKKDYANAEKYYFQVLKVNPENVRLRIDLANMYRFYFDGKQNEILQLIEVDGLALTPDDLNLLIFLANYYRYEIEDFDKAIFYYERVIALDPLNQAVRIELWNLHEQLGR